MATPLNPNNPIPNGPFSYPQSWYLFGPYGPIVTGAGLYIDPLTSTICSTGGGGGGGAVNQLLPGPGIALNPLGGTGNVTICNTGVLGLSAGPGINISNSGGTYTVSTSAIGAVTSITAGPGLTGGTITSSGSLALNFTCVIPPTAFTGKGQLLAGVSAGNYATIDATSSPNGYVLTSSSASATGMAWCAGGNGSVTSVTGTAPVTVVNSNTTPVISVQAATTTSQGITQLINNTTTNDSTKALTAAQGYSLQQQLNGLLIGGGLTLAGTFDATAGTLSTVTAAGTAASFSVGSNLPAPSAGNANLFVIITTSGTYSPPGGGGTYVTTQGDWILSNGTLWTYLNTGYDAPSASTAVAGQVRLATTVETQTGTNTAIAITPVGAAATYVPLNLYATKGSIIAGSSVSSVPIALPVGTDGQVLTACAACALGLTWKASSGGTGGAQDTPVGLISWFPTITPPTGWLVADGSTISRTTYADLFAVIGTTYGAGDGSTTFQLPDLRGEFLRGWDAAGGTARGCDLGRAFGSNQTDSMERHCHILDSGGNGAIGHPSWACTATGSGTITASLTFSSQTVRRCGLSSTVGTGTETRPINVALLPCIKYQTTLAPIVPSSGIPCACIVSKGAILTGDAPNSPVALPVGTDGQWLRACSACTLGMTWCDYQPDGIPGWTSAGTIQSVGWDATTTAPTIGAAVRNAVNYRQLGAKQWEIVYSFHKTTATGYVAGVGDYLFTLPNGLKWDLTLPFQTAESGDVGADIYDWFGIAIPSANGNMNVSTNGTAAGFMIVPWDLTRFRVIATIATGGTVKPWSSSFYAISNAIVSTNFTFQLTSL